MSTIKHLEDLRYFFTDKQWNNILYHKIKNIFDDVFSNTSNLFWEEHCDENGDIIANEETEKEVLNKWQKHITDSISFSIFAASSKFDNDDKTFKPIVKEESVHLINILRNRRYFLTIDNALNDLNETWYPLIQLEIKKLCTLNKLYDRTAYYPRFFYKIGYLLHSYYAKDILDEIQISE